MGASAIAPSTFAAMLAQVKFDRLRAIDPLSAEWVTFVLLGVAVLLALTNLNSPRKWRLVAQAIFRMRLGRQTLREEIDLQDRTLIGLLVAAAGVIALFTWQALIQAGGPKVPAYLTLLGAVTGIVIMQALFLKLTAGLMQVDHGLGEFLYTGLLLFILMGAALLPLTVLMAYHPAWRTSAVTLGFAAIALLFLYRWVRGAWIGLGEGVPIRYIFLYLCTAEILPVLLLLKASRHPVTPL